MTTTQSPDTGPGQPPAEAPGDSEIFLGAGQALWLALVTVVAVVALVLSLVAVVVVYNDDDDASSAAAPPAAGATSVDFSGTEFSFDPSSATVVANTDVEISLTNDGAVQHELVILNAGVNLGSEADFIDSMVLDQVDPLDAGGSGSVSVSLQAGNYQIACLIAGHFDAGMKGTLVAS